MRLLASDLDGTLVGASGVLSPRTRAMLDACDAAGVPVVFVTGRPPRWLDAWLDGRSGVAICANGALVVDLPTRAVLEATTFEPAVVLDVAARLRSVLPHATFGIETPDGFAMEPAYVRQYDDGPAPIAPLAELMQGPVQVTKILVRVPGVRSDDLLAAGPSAAVRRRRADSLQRCGRHARDRRTRREQGLHPGPVGRSSRDRRGRCRGVRGHAERRRDVALGRAVLRDERRSSGGGRGREGLAPPCEQDGVAQMVEVLLAGR